MAQNVSVRYILCKSKCEFMAIELNWNWFAAPASRGCTLPTLPYTIFCWCFTAAVATAWDAKKYATLLVAWQASDRRQTTRQTCHGNLWARRQLPINYVHVHGKTTASSVRQRERDGDKERKGRQWRIKRSKLQTAWKETNRMSHVDLNNWSLTWIIATPRAACPSRSGTVVASGGPRSVDVRASRLKMESPHRRLHVHGRTRGLWQSGCRVA